MSMTALLVEDNALNRLLFSEVLNLAGFEVVADHTGSEALRLSVDHRPTVALVDLGLPGCPGLEVIRRLRAGITTRRMPIIAVSAFARTEDGLAALNAGADMFFCKPVDTHRLVHALSRLTEPAGESVAGSAA
ncbi:MAG: response regulator [Pseudomonadota bacterium]